MATLFRSRGIEHQVVGQAVTDGAGVRIRRLLGQEWQRRLDPFLMLDSFRSDDPGDYLAGFPDHPHRGFETITYMMTGRMRHRDNAGHEGLLESGGMQWMIAGRGVIHSEMPEQENGLMEGLQLWLNLPARDKMREPWYQDFRPQEIPLYVTPEGVGVRVVAGSSRGVAGAVSRPVTEPLYLDIHLPAGSRFLHPLPQEHNAFLFVCRGRVSVAGQEVVEGSMGILSTGGDTDGVAIDARAEAARLVLVAGRPLGEPIVQHGPFVMTSEADIRTAIKDFRSGRFTE